MQRYKIIILLEQLRKELFFTKNIISEIDMEVVYKLNIVDNNIIEIIENIKKEIANKKVEKL